VNHEQLSHLQAPYRAYALLSASERIQWIRQDRWIHYSRAEQVLNRLSDLLTYPAETVCPVFFIWPDRDGKDSHSAKNPCVSIDQALMTLQAERDCRSSQFRCRQPQVSATFMKNCW
jgi:hypothetical protein